MNTTSASESGSNSTNNTRPFFYAQPTAQPPFPNPWYLSHAYSPYYVPAPGFRSGNPCFPFYSVALHEYPGYVVPHHPLHARVHRRPYFNGPTPSPVFYHATRFRHYSTPGRKMETKETQTDPRQPENKQKKHQDIHTETKGCDAGNVACVSPGIGTETESISEKQDSCGSSIVVDRDFHKSPSSSAQYRNLPTGSYAFEKEEVRIEYGNGSPAIQLWKSFKETIPLYDVASGKSVPENIVQRDLFSVSSCEGMIYGPREGEKMVPGASLDERKAVLSSKHAVETAQEKEVQNEVKLDSEKQVNTSQGLKSPPSETMAVQTTELARSVSIDPPVVRKDAVAAKKSSSKKSTGSKVSQEEPSFSQQAGPLPSSMEVMNELSFQQKKLNLSHSVTNESQTDKSIWCDESIEKYVPSNSWLACLDSMDTNYNYDLCLPQRKHPSVLSLSSDDMSSREEGSSIDNAYFVPDYVLQKSTYTFQKSTEGLQKEKIKSGGSLNEEVGKEQMNSLDDQDVKNSSTMKTKEASGKGRKLGALPKSSSQKKPNRLKKKAAKSLSEVEDSEEYSVRGEEEEEEDGGEEEEEDDDDDDMDEIEYFFPEATPYGILAPSKGSFYQVGQTVLWKPPTNAIPAQLISWPAQEKIKARIGLGEDISVVYKPKEKVQDEVVYSDYACYGRKRSMARREGLEHQRTLRKFLGGRLLKENMGISPEEYWIRSGAKPKFTSQIHGSISPPAKSKEQGCPPLVKPKKKRIGKPLSKRRDTRHEVEEVWEAPKSACKGRGTRKSLYKRR